MDVIGNIIVFLNPILIAIVGYFIRLYMEENKALKAKVGKQDKDITTLKESHHDLKDMFRKLDERLRARDDKLIDRLTDQIDKLRNQ